MGILFLDMLRNKLDMKKAETAVKRAENQDNRRFREEHTFAGRQTTVSTKAQLEDAISKRYGSIIIVGDLAESVSKAYKIKNKLSLLEKTPHATNAAGLAFLGVSETVIITAIIALAVVLVIAMLKNYNIDTDIHVSNENGVPTPKVKLRIVK